MWESTKINPGSYGLRLELAGPFPYCQTFSLGQALDGRHFLIGKQYLKALTHRVSLVRSQMETPVYPSPVRSNARPMKFGPINEPVQARRNASTAFSPPNANEFDRAYSTCAGRA
jgi:hypothetical protein